MEILVLGGSYFLGKRFVELGCMAHPITVLNRGTRQLPPALASKIKQIKADRHDKEKLRAELAKPYDVVVDFCAYQKGDISGVLDCMKTMPEKYVFISTCDVYERNTGKFMKEEDALEERDFGGEAGEYICGKVALEAELEAEASRRGFQPVSIRPAIIYGPENYAPREEMYFNWIWKAGQVILPADADGQFQMVYVDDVARAVLRICGTEKSCCFHAAYNICSDQMLTYQDFEAALWSAVSVEFETLTLPVAQIEAQQIPLPFPMRKEETQYYDGQKGLTLISEYTSLKDGLSRAFADFRRKYAFGILEEIDLLFRENKAKDAEKYMLKELEAARRNRDLSLELTILNELIGYYRQTSEADRLKETIHRTLEVTDALGIRRTVDGATSLLNAANGYRSIGELEKSLAFYKEVQSVYEAAIHHGVPGNKAPAEGIQNSGMDRYDMRYAGFLNNMSLLLQEMGQYGEALELQKKALEISEENHAGFETAVSYANLSESYAALHDYAAAAEHAKTAIRIFEERNCLDAHYCAALATLGICEYKTGKDDAARYFEKGMEIIESTLGRNAQYEKLKANRDMCLAGRMPDGTQGDGSCLNEPDAARGGSVLNEPVAAGGMEKADGTGETALKMTSEGDTQTGGPEKADGTKTAALKVTSVKNAQAGGSAADTMEQREMGAMGHQTKQEKTETVKGLDLCRRYYETYGVPMIKQYFPEYEDRIAAGLAGQGSDCFGFDDEISRDHDWGPDFCLWLTDDDYDKIGTEFQERYNELPKEFEGCQRTASKQGAGRRGVMKISTFFETLLGLKLDVAGAEGIPDNIPWRQASDAGLAAAVNGCIFRDDLGYFTKLRQSLLQGYPQQIQLLKIAENAAGFAQCCQYNYRRMLGRGDRMTAEMMLADGIRHALRLLHHMENVYPPHDKWLRKSAEKLFANFAGNEVDENAAHPAATPGAEAGDRMQRGSGDNADAEKLRAEQLGKDVLALLAKVWDDKDEPETAGKWIEQIGELLALELYRRNIISDIDPYLDAHTEEILLKASYASDSGEELVKKIARMEFEAFDKVKNEGGRASCQNDWPTFSVMRKSQYLLWDRDMLLQYIYDFKRELSIGHNLITEKYGRMMESTAPEKYKELAPHFPYISEEKKQVIEQIVGIQMVMAEEFAKVYPNVAGNARNLHTYEDNPADTSYETYLRGEISTYSDKMLQLYGQFVVKCYASGRNIARETIENTARLYGYQSIEELEEKELKAK